MAPSLENSGHIQPDGIDILLRPLRIKTTPVNKINKSK